MKTQMIVKAAAAALVVMLSGYAAAAAQETAPTTADINAAVAAHSDAMARKLEARTAAAVDRMLEARIAHVEATQVPAAVYASKLPADEQFLEPTVRLAARGE